MLSSEFYEKLDPSYNKQIQLLEKNLHAAKNENEEMEALQEFSTCYMMPWQLWERYLRIALHTRFYKDNLKHYNFHLPLYQFFYSQNNHFFIRICQKSFKRKTLFTNLQNILNQFNESISNRTAAFIKDVSVLIENLAFPHQHLKEIWHLYEKSLCWSPTKKMKQNYQKMLDLYKKIMSQENDEEKWIEALAETNDLEFVEHVVEYKIGSDLTNKKLWHVYINYLKLRVSQAKIDYWKEQFTKKLMHTYSKYCHFFLDDETMLEEYQIAAEESGGNVAVPWMNIFPFETYDIHSIISLVTSRKFIYHQPHVDPLTCNFNPENMVSQRFLFKGSLMYYIQKTAKTNIILKLQQTCKYFYIRNPIWICYKLRYIAHAANGINQVKYHRQSVEIRSTALFYPDNDLYVTTAIEFSADNRDDLSSFIPRIFKCDAKFVYIFYQDLSIEEFTFLTKNVVDLSLHNVRIFNKNGEVLFLEEILEMVLNVQYLDTRSIVTNSQTFQKLCNIDFKNEFCSWKFDFTDINEFNSTECAEFVIQNGCSNFSLNIEFRFADHQQWMNGRQIVSNNENLVNQIIKQKCLENNKPSFKMTSRF